MGYSRHGDPDGITHAWVKFGRDCDMVWKQQVTIDFLLSVCGIALMTVAPVVQWVPKAVPNKSSQPLAAEVPVTTAVPSFHTAMETNGSVFCAQSLRWPRRLCLFFAFEVNTKLAPK